MIKQKNKFKIGDKVRCIIHLDNNYFGLGWELGKEFIIDRIIPKDVFSDACYFAKKGFGVFEIHLELVEEIKTYKTKDSGERKQFDSGMQRDTEINKPRFDLITPLNQPYNETMLYRLAMLMGRGAEKYSEMDRYKSSAFRHFMQWFSNEEDGEDHASAVFFNINAFEHVKGKLK